MFLANFLVVFVILNRGGTRFPYLTYDSLQVYRKHGRSNIKSTIFIFSLKFSTGRSRSIFPYANASNFFHRVFCLGSISAFTTIAFHGENIFSGKTTPSGRRKVRSSKRFRALPKWMTSDDVRKTSQCDNNMRHYVVCQLGKFYLGFFSPSKFISTPQKSSDTSFYVNGFLWPIETVDAATLQINTKSKIVRLEKFR